MNAYRKTLVLATSVAALLPASTVLAHSGADSGAVAATIHTLLHAAPIAGLVLAGVALAGLIQARRSSASDR